MKSKKIKFIVGVALAGILTSGLAFAKGSGGGDTSGGFSGGGDHHEFGSGTAWFLGDKPVTYCIEVSIKFGVPVEKIRSDVESAAKTWRAYLEERGLMRKSRDGSPLTPQELNLNLQYSGACRGGENLKFYMGMENETVLKAKAKFDRPYAFAHRESYDAKSGMGQGFIWFANPGSIFPDAGSAGFPNWSLPYTLHGMLLHELGHALGVGHLDGTIMQENMISFLQMMEGKEEWAKRRGHAFLTNIDDQKILYFDHNSNTELAIDGRIEYSASEYEGTTKPIFRQFIGRDPVGKVRMQFLLHSGMARLKFTDDQSTEILTLASSRRLVSEFHLLSNIFGMWRKEGVDLIKYTDSHGINGLGSIEARDGKVYTAQYSINAEGLSGPVRVTFIDSGKPKILFLSNTRGGSDE